MPVLTKIDGSLDDSDSFSRQPVGDQYRLCRVPFNYGGRCVGTSLVSLVQQPMGLLEFYPNESSRTEVVGEMESRFETITMMKTNGFARSADRSLAFVTSHLQGEITTSADN
ncbi:hypothetical protein RRG08_003526 [Elysia crispata]|uniref:Uncharacterized protein n=1 Tax=Elysia crispata TaxID=231223 RepID=A0AAE1CTM3_9GAST|nr:hypothetical protein RRG08_003526 [Elysia crispata]